VKVDFELPVILEREVIVMDVRVPTSI